MPDYKSLYLKLLRAHGQALQILTQAGQEAEELVLRSKDPVRLPERRIQPAKPPAKNAPKKTEAVARLGFFTAYAENLLFCRA